ncbi:MAG TPA: hypothetical protein DEG17_10990 [Cyanobacteria bacterium UBA11149]|nr:hypothetical protein [Cyanobacteria bacterium UBA11366]HBR75532.1 hypothetical protein [Cyanobacteria bacterium UBA11159]HBW89374.1 hypothetical protein [Cyanobacteria bacterium UBA11149]HCA93540.1 hypothetical protein [Cyanobacteria bacterium UBA9226]
MERNDNKPGNENTEARPLIAPGARSEIHPSFQFSVLSSKRCWIAINTWTNGKKTVSVIQGGDAYDR